MFSGDARLDSSAAGAGAISKQDLRRFLRWAAVHLGYPSLDDVEAAPPSAELEPIREGVAAQTDEQDMGMTYEELGIYGRLRKLSRCGPVSMFRHLLVLWQDRSAFSFHVMCNVPSRLAFPTSVTSCSLGAARIATVTAAACRQ